MADEEVARSEVLQGEEVQDEVLRNNSSKEVGRNKRSYDNDDVEIDHETGKSRKKRKRDIKEQKKERREEKDYGSKDKDRSMRMRKGSSRDVEKHGSREMVRERVGSSSDKKKEFLGDYVNDSEALEYDEEKARDKIRARDYTRSKHREDREHEHAKYKKDTYQKRERNVDMVQEESRDHGKDRGRGGRYKGKERDKEKFVDPSSDRSIDREHDQNRDQMKDKALEGGNEKVVEDRVLHWDHEHVKEREKVYGHHRDQDEDSETSKNKAHEKSKIREKDHTQEIDKALEWGKVRENYREGRNDREKEKTQDHYWSKEKKREKLKDLEMVSEKVGERDRFEKYKGKKRHREKEVDVVADQVRSSARDIEREISRKEVKMEENLFAKHMVDGHEVVNASNKISFDDHSAKAMDAQTSSELAERLKKMKEERMNGDSQASLEVLSWVNKSRKLEEKRNSENEKATTLARKLDEQDKILDESEDEESIEDHKKCLAGVKVLHGLDKVMEGATVVLTLKDQNILADGDVNEEVDMLENVEIGEQKSRNEAYNAAKKKTTIYDDKFSDDLIARKTILPQYDDPVDDEGVTLDESGRFTGEAERKLSELRKRIEGKSLKKDYADLSSSVKIQSNYFTTDEMLQFKRPKKKKSLRKKERLDLDALEVEARATGLGLGDLGTRGDMNRLSAREEEEKNMAKTRSNAYQSALTKAEEASNFLLQELSLTSIPADDDSLKFGEDYEDLQKSLEQSRKLTLKIREEAASFGPRTVALLATALREQDNTQASTIADTPENKLVITEMEEFVFGLQINEGSSSPISEDVFKVDEDDSMSVDPEIKRESGGWTEEKGKEMDELSVSGERDNITPDEIIHETAVGKGLSGALKLLKDRGTLKESIDWGGRNMDKKKSKLVGIYANDGTKEVRIERTDEFGRILTPKESFRILSHKFHGKGPGKMKLEKRMKQYHEDLKAKHMKASDTPLLAMEKMREAQARLQSPYIVLSGNVKPGQTSDPRSGFATVERDNPGSLTPMLGDKKVEHFLGIRNKHESGSMGPPPAKKPKL